MESATSEKADWIDKTINIIFSYREDGAAAGTPEEMIDEAGRRAFKIGTALGLIPGPLGIAVILPEIAVLTRLQLGLIHHIAAHYGKQEQLGKELVLLILGNALGVAVGEGLVRKAGSALLLRSMNSGVARGVARKIGARMIETAAEKATGRWLPMVTAPLFGWFSRSLTRKIGREAQRLLSQEIAFGPMRDVAPLTNPEVLPAN